MKFVAEKNFVLKYQKERVLSCRLWFRYGVQGVR